MKNNLNTFLIALAVVVSAWMFSSAFRNRNKSNNSISVTGLGSKNFVSDLIVWNGYFMRKEMDLKTAYAELDRDREGIRTYLVSKGLKGEEIVFSAVEIEKEFDELFNNVGKKTGSVFTGYRLKQSVQIESGAVDQVEGISREVSELINTGVEFYSNAPQYYYTKLAALKVEMIAEATKDANTRAKKIAENAGGEVGQLKNASMGVFQIVAQNSSEDFSWGGSFNTASKKKTANITIRLEYGIN